MLVVSDALKNAFMQEERQILIRLTIGSRVFNNDNVKTIEYTSGSLAGDVFAIGSTYSNSIKVTFSELVEGLKELDEVTYEIGVKLPDETIGYVPMGKFIINSSIKMDRNNNKTSIECMDKMSMLGGPYVSSLTYPTEIRLVALEIANKAGVEVSTESFARLSADHIAKPEGYTYREAIGLIAQFQAGFATFDRFGKLDIRNLVDPNFSIPPNNYFSKGLDKNEVFFRLGGISCTTDSGGAVIQSGNTAGNQIALENRVMTKGLLDKIYAKIQTINYYPFSLSWQGNPVLEAGDWIEVEDLKGNKFKTPNLNYSLSFNGGMNAKSSAETATQSDVTYGYTSPLQQRIEYLITRIDAAGGNVVFEGIDTPTNAKEGDLWFKIIGPDVEILIYKKDTNGVLSWVSQISTADLDKVAEEVNKIIEQADADRAKVLADVATAKAETKAYVDNEIIKFDIAFDAETGAIRNEITTGYTNAVASANEYTQVKANEFNANLAVVQTSLNQTVIKANDAVTKAEKAISDVGFVKTDLVQVKADATNALGTAQTSLANSGTALANAQTALNAYNNLQIGDRNLLVNSGSIITNAAYVMKNYYFGGNPPKEGEKVTIAIKFTLGQDRTSLSLFTSAGYKQLVMFSASEQDANGIVVKTFTISYYADKGLQQGFNYVTIYQTPNSGTSSSQIEWVKLVRGEKTSKDWIAAPEDVQVQITAINGELATKVSQSTFDTLNGTVGTHTTQISQTQTALLAKAESSLVNTIKGTVDSHTTQIKVVSDGLELKAESSLVNTVKGTVDSHTTQINANSQAITARLTSVQIETLLTGKQYVNQTTLNATSTGLTAQITQVSNDLGNLAVGGTNLLPNSSFKDKTSFDSFGAADLTKTLVVGEYTLLNRTSANTGRATLSKNIDLSDNFVVGDSITVSIDVYVESLALDGSTVFARFPNTSGGFQDNGLAKINANIIKNKWVRIYGTTTIAANTDFTKNVTATFAINGTGRIRVRNMQIERGNIASDWSPSFSDMATLEKVVTIEANINGINLLVANKAEQSQVTQLAGQITTKVESSTYNSKMTQLDSAINLRVVQSDITDAILADKAIKDTRNDNQLPSWYLARYPRQIVKEFKIRTIMALPGSQYYSLVTTEVPYPSTDNGNISVVQTAESKDGSYKRASITDTTWTSWEKTADTGSLIAQINISTEGILLQGKRIQLDGEVTMTSAFVNRIDGNTLNVVIANIATIRAQVLVADVITSTHIKADNAMMDKLFTTVAVVDYLFTKTAFVNNLTVKTLSAVTANITTIRSQVLITNSVTATHVVGDTAMIDNLFATTALIDRLTTKSAFIANIKAIDIAADRITTGTLNAALVNIINLNASRITTGVLSGISITSPFNYIYSGTIRNVGTTTIATGDITMNGTFSNGTGSTYLKLNADGLYGDNLTQTGAVRSLFKLNGDGITVVKGGDTAYYRQDGVYFESGGGATIKYYPPNARIEIGSWNGVSLGVNSSGSFYNRITVGGGGDGLAPFVDIWTDLNLRSTLNVGGNLVKNAKYINGISELLFADTSNRIVQGSNNVLSIMSPVAIDMGYTNGTTTSNSLTINNAGTTFAKAVQFNGNAINGANNINNAQTILFHNTSNRIVQASDGQLNILSPTQINLGWTNGSSVSNVVSITNNQVVISRTLNMNSNSITNQSDRRLKMGIYTSLDESLKAIDRWNFVNFQWRDPDKKRGNQLGLISQDTPELTLYDAENDVYMIDSSKQLVMTTHGVQQLYREFNKVVMIDHEKRITANDERLTELEKEYKLLREEINKLKGVA